ncbi:MAG TPA: diaminopropionate ammonia-lyase [Bacteroidales bacterium]|jgi:diaminopropionate ammonia-lyase|nr:diaminopropionate ammonia-lyase [Bacteroidales bacterium]
MSATGYLINKQAGYSPQLADNVQTILNDFNASFKFHQSLASYRSTPLVELATLAKKTGINRLLVKDESQRFGTGALKILGATFAVNHFAENEDVIGICTATDGNHGRAVAWASRQRGIKSVVFVPVYTAKSRIEAIEDEGAKVIVSKGDYDTAVSEAAYFAREKNFKLIQDTAWSNYMDVPAYITAGYYTQLNEIAQQTNNFTSPRIDVIFVQAGVGSWPSAVVHFLRKNLDNQHIKIVCVEPYESDCIYESIRRKSLTTTAKSQKTIMAGLNCGTPSALALEILKEGIDAFLLISDKHSIDAIKYLNAPLPGDPYVVAGESGAAGLAGYLATVNSHGLAELKNYLAIGSESNILVVNSENITDPLLTSSLLEE